MGGRHKGIITYESSSESTKTLLMLALLSPIFTVLATLTLQSGLDGQIPVLVIATLVPLHKILTPHLLL